MSQPSWRTQYRDATAAPPPSAKERVWRSMQRRERPRVWVPALAVGAAAAALAFSLALPRAQTDTQTLDGFAYQATQAVFTREGNRFSLQSGRLAVDAWQGRVVVAAQGHHVELESAIAIVEVAGESVRVTPVEGIALFDAAVMKPNRELRQSHAASLSELTRAEPAEALANRAEAEARVATQEARWADAAEALSVVAKSSSLRAESALLKRGDLELRALHDPAAALATFQEGDARFPGGVLSEERALSALEAEVALQRWPNALTRADDFLARFPSSGKAAEVRRAREVALQTIETQELSAP